jgi:hypothetical protein
MGDDDAVLGREQVEAQHHRSQGGGCAGSQGDNVSMHGLGRYESTGRAMEARAVHYNSRTRIHGADELGDVLHKRGRELLARELAPLHHQRLCHGLDRGRVT